MPIAAYYGGYEIMVVTHGSAAAISDEWALAVCELYGVDPSG
ncbi:MAG: hypothetical protein U0003_01410 [Vampirovibrionales bacterium]